MGRTELKSLGEFGLINKLTNRFDAKSDKIKKGIGDDAAVIKMSDEECMVITTDMLAEAIHFDLTFTPLKHLGYKCVAVNISDIAAMNAKPIGITISIGVSNRFSVEALEEFYTGVHAACEQYGISLIGGDTTSSASGFVVSVTAIGSTHPDNVVYRSGAKPGDIVCVSGDLGGAYLGLTILQREKAAFKGNPDMQPQLDQWAYVVGRQLRPEARMDVIYDMMEEKVVPHAMIDISDGLASEIMHICKNSGVGIEIREGNMPISDESMKAAYEFGLGTTTAAMNGGEDYELLIVLSPSDYEKMEKHPDIIPIGTIKEDPEYIKLLTKGGSLHSIEAQGWDHFKKE